MAAMLVLILVSGWPKHVHCDNTIMFFRYFKQLQNVTPTGRYQLLRIGLILVKSG